MKAKTVTGVFHRVQDDYVRVTVVVLDGELVYEVPEDEETRRIREDEIVQVELAPSMRLLQISRIRGEWEDIEEFLP